MVHGVDRRAALADAVPLSFWLDDPSAPVPAPQVTGRISSDLAIVGGGYTGLWTALLAKSEDPELDVVVLEADRCGWAASGRNGGFCSASLTHGLANGIDRFPDEIAVLQRLGHQNLDDIERTVGSWTMDCGFERTGDMAVATEPYQVEDLRRAAEVARDHGEDLDYLDVERVRSEVHSPTYLAGLWDKRGSAMVNPARLAWGLRQACEDAGVRIFEHSAADTIEAAESGAGPLHIKTGHGEVQTQKAALGTNAYPSLVRRLRRYVVPVYDYVLMTESLTPGARRLWEPVPLLPAQSGQPHSVRRLRRHLPLRQRTRSLLGATDPDVLEAGGTIRGDLSATGRGAFHPRLGGRHRHLLALLRLLRPVGARAGGFRRGLHRSRSGCFPLRCPSDARSAFREGN
jgi:glycine/D-amino acid oxidase-like deaminating enzyme